MGQRILYHMEKIIVWVVELGIRPWILGNPTGLVFCSCWSAFSCFYDFHREKKWLLGTEPDACSAIFITKHLENEVTVVDVGQGIVSFAGHAGADGSD